MASERQIEANRRNAMKSTGPRTYSGKQRSRRNAIRHGLTAETIVDVFEDPEDYKAFENAIVADFKRLSTVEYVLVTRLASLLWRLRRATAVESGLWQIQAEILRSRKVDLVRTIPPSGSGLDMIYRPLPSTALVSRRTWGETKNNEAEGVEEARKLDPHISRQVEIAQCFLRLANLRAPILEKLPRYEGGLWKQVAQTLLILRGNRRQP